MLCEGVAADINDDTSTELLQCWLDSELLDIPLSLNSAPEIFDIFAVL